VNLYFANLQHVFINRTEKLRCVPRRISLLHHVHTYFSVCLFSTDWNMKAAISKFSSFYILLLCRLAHLKLKTVDIELNQEILFLNVTDLHIFLPPIGNISDVSNT